MRKFIWLLSGLLFLTGACSTSASREDKNMVQLKGLSDEVRQNHAPDRRSRTYEVTFKADTTAGGVVYVARGATTQAEAKQALAAAAAGRGITLLDSITLLPDPALGEKTYGLTDQSVINFRYGPGYASESATQTLMGMPLRILEKRGGWVRAMTPEGYIAWVNAGAREMARGEYDAWMQASKLIVTTHYTLFRETPSATGAVASDGVWGNIVRADGEQGAYYKVILPTGLSAFVPKKDVQKFNDWLRQRNPGARNLIATGRQFIGFPYLWGGTSIKAMDCSGFVKTCFYLNGVIIPRDASQQAQAGEQVDISGGHENLQPGDLLFFGSRDAETGRERITHVAMYIGQGEYIHSAGRVHISSLLPGASNYASVSARLVRAQRYIHLIDKDKNIVSIARHPWYDARE